MRRFYLLRVDDESGVSGKGIVAEGAELMNGQAILSWLTEHSSVALYPSVKELEIIHGHGGKSKVVFTDDEGMDRSLLAYHRERFSKLGF